MEDEKYTIILEWTRIDGVDDGCLHSVIYDTGDYDTMYRKLLDYAHVHKAAGKTVTFTSKTSYDFISSIAKGSAWIE